MPYIPFTEEQKVMANFVDLEQFLRMRGEKLERVGREHKLIYYDGSGKHDSITLRGSTWFDHKNQVGGGAIKFMQEFYDMDFQTAVQELLGQTITPLSHAPSKAVVHEEKTKEFKLPEANSNMHRVFAYLIKQRFISPDIISHFAKQHTLYEDKQHHNAVFVGLDENGVPRQASKRSTNSFGKTFRITCEGSDTRCSFSHFGKSEKLFVFEAPIDMMSFLTLYPQEWQKNSYIAMNGVYENAVLTALKNHSNLEDFRGVATIVPNKGARVPVLIWELDERDLPTLNKYEGYPSFYRQEKMTFEMDGKTYEGMAYLMNRGTIFPPSQQYYNTILQGYRENGLDEKYLQTALENSQQLEYYVNDEFDEDFDDDYDLDDDMQMRF